MWLMIETWLYCGLINLYVASIEVVQSDISSKIKQDDTVDGLAD
jgi:hypothetical protein